MQTSLQNQLLTLSLKMDTGLHAIDQLSQLLILLVAELQGTEKSLERTNPAVPESPLLEIMLDQLSTIRQDLQRSAQPIAYVRETTHLESSSLLLEDPIPSNFREDHRVSLHHKDVLEDDDSFGVDNTVNGSVSADMQVRRLMAQLTAAYNRIAALEEQLLSSPRHSYASQE